MKTNSFKVTSQTPGPTRASFNLIRPLMASAAVALLAALMASAGDWPNYRGPNHDGISSELIRTNWPADPPKEIWKVPLGPALCSLTVSGGRVFTQARRRVAGKDREFCLALDAGTGKELWATDVGGANYGGGYDGHLNPIEDGPRSTPTVSGERVFVLTSFLRLVCLNAGTGLEVWRKDLVAEYDGSVIGYESSASPLVEGDLVLVNCNALHKTLSAFRTQDGTLAWQVQNTVSANRLSTTHATPIAATLVGVRQAIFYTQQGLVSVRPESGEILWNYRVPFNGFTAAASPVVGEDIVYCSAAYGTGAGAVRIQTSDAGLTTNQVWRTRGANGTEYATPVYHEGYLYGPYGQYEANLKCLDLATGRVKWTVSKTLYDAHGAVLLVAGHLLQLTDKGELVLIKPDPSAYQEITRFQAVKGRCWNAPAISDGRLYVRSAHEAACFDVALKGSPPLRLRPEFTRANGRFRLSIAKGDGSPLDADAQARVQVFATTNLPAGPGGWLKLTQPTTLNNGELQLEDPDSSSLPRRFYRTEEQP